MFGKRTFNGTGTRCRRGFAPALLACAAIALVFAGTLQAQEGSASLRGDVILGPEADLGAATVTAVDVGSGYRRTVDVRADGSYSFRSLRPGQYRLEVATPDGLRKTDILTLRVGQEAELDLDFVEAAVSASEDAEQIIVVGRALTTLESGEIGLNITPRLIQTLPQNSRNFLAFADLAPGVSFERGGNGATRIQGGAQNSRTVNVFIDGISQKDYVLKGGITGQDTSPGNPFPQSAIGEYRVISQNYKAEFEQVSSAAIVAITKSGTNEFHGDIFWDYTDDGFRSKTPLEEESDLEKVETTDSQFGVSLGGPIIEDRLHFFFAYEGKRNELPVEVTAGAGLTAADLPAEYADLVGVFNREFVEDLFFGKLDFLATDEDLFQFSVKVRQETGLRWDNGPNTPSFTHDINNDETRVMLRYERTADNWINNVRVTYEDSAWNPQPGRENAKFLELSGNQRILNVGGHPNFQDKGQSGWGIQDDFLWTGFDDHDVKAGVSLKWIELSTIQQQPFNPQYHYNTEFDPTGTGAFNDEIPYRLVFGAPLEGIGDGSASSDNFQLGIYVQDDWQVTDRFALSYGVRWDYEKTPIYLDYVTPADAVASLTSWTNLDNADYDIENFISDGGNRDTFTGAIQPRIGFSFDLTDDGRYTLFGGYGRSYDRNQFDFIQLESTAQTFARNDFRFETGDPEHACPGCPVWDPIYLTEEGRDQLLASAAPGGGRQLFLLGNDLEVPYSDQYSLGVRATWDVWQGEFGVSRVEARDGFGWLLGNRLPDGSFFAPGAIWGPPFGSPPPGFGNILLGVNGLESNANSAHLKAAKLYDEVSGWGLHVTYTYTDAEENRKFNETFSLDYPSLADYPMLRSSGVSRHRLVAAGNVDLPWEIGLSAKFSYESAPYVYGVGIPDAPNDQRVPRVVKAADDFKQLDLALVKYFPLPFAGFDDSTFRIRFDVLNVLNEENFDTFVGNGGSEDFGEVNNFGIGGNLPRTFKMSVGMSF